MIRIIGMSQTIPFNRTLLAFMIPLIRCGRTFPAIMALWIYSLFPNSSKHVFRVYGMPHQTVVETGRALGMTGMANSPISSASFGRTNHHGWYSHISYLDAGNGNL